MNVRITTALLLCVVAAGCAAPPVQRLPVVSRPVPLELPQPTFPTPETERPAVRAARPAAPARAAEPRSTEARPVERPVPRPAAAPAEPGSAVPLEGFRPMRGQRATPPS